VRPGTRLGRVLGTVKRAALVAVGILAMTAGSPAAGQGRADYLIRLLKTSDTFRVRAQAALSLGRLEADEAVVGALSGALRDPHPAVRSAAASSLEKLGDPSALPALRLARKDDNSTAREAVHRAIASLERIARTRPRAAPLPPDEAPSGPARFYVAVATPKSNSGSVPANTLAEARQVLVRQLGQMDGVLIAPEKEPPGKVKKVLSDRKLLGYHVESSVVQIEETSSGTRAVVSVILATYPGRDMRAMLQGSATVPGARGPSAAAQAIEGALTGALRRLPQALVASASRDGG
jgi:hypothetical protein